VPPGREAHCWGKKRKEGRGGRKKGWAEGRKSVRARRKDYLRHRGYGWRA